MAEPLLPHPHATTDGTAAAEPGAGAPAPDAPEEPDVLPENLDENLNENLDEGVDTADDAVAGAQPGDPPSAEAAFRTPTPGDRLTVEELEQELPN